MVGKIEEVEWFSSLGGVSSIPFPFRFPFQLHCELVSSLLALQGDKYVSERLSEAVRGHEVIRLLTLFKKLCYPDIQDSKKILVFNITPLWPPPRPQTSCEHSCPKQGSFLHQYQINFFSIFSHPEAGTV